MAHRRPAPSRAVQRSRSGQASSAELRRPEGTSEGGRRGSWKPGWGGGSPAADLGKQVGEAGGGSARSSDGTAAREESAASPPVRRLWPRRAPLASRGQAPLARPLASVELVWCWWAGGNWRLKKKWWARPNLGYAAAHPDHLLGPPLSVLHTLCRPSCAG